MQSPDGAYVEQIQPGPRPPGLAPAPRIIPAPSSVRTPPPPAGLYVQVASVPDPQQAVQAGLAFAQRLGADRPPFIRGVSVREEGETRMRLFAGPFADEEIARRFCTLALPDTPCLLQRLGADQPSGKSGPAAGGP